MCLKDIEAFVIYFLLNLVSIIIKMYRQVPITRTRGLQAIPPEGGRLMDFRSSIGRGLLAIPLYDKSTPHGTVHTVPVIAGYGSGTGQIIVAPNPWALYYWIYYL